MAYYYALNSFLFATIFRGQGLQGLKPESLKTLAARLRFAKVVP